MAKPEPLYLVHFEVSKQWEVIDKNLAIKLANYKYKNGRSELEYMVANNDVIKLPWHTVASIKTADCPCYSLSLIHI